MESKRRISEEAARKLADDARARTGARIGPNTIQKVLSGFRPYRGAFAARAVCEQAGLHVPHLREEDDR